MNIKTSRNNKSIHNLRNSFLACAILCLSTIALPGYAADQDSDGIDDGLDNCLLVPNPAQRDTNADGYGNVCDPDLNNDGTVNFLDLGIMRSVLFTANPDADLNGDSAVNFVDLGIMRSMLFQPPGPSGLLPQNLQAIPGDSQVTLSWDAVVGATSYNIYWNTTGGVTTSDAKIAGVTSPYDHTSLTNGTTYYYIVTAVNAIGESSPSSEVSATPQLSPPATAAAASLSFDIKTFRFSWTDVSDATYYKLLENPDGTSGFAQVGSDIPQGMQSVDHSVALYQRLNASYILQSCNATGCTDDATIAISGPLVNAIGYFKASNTEISDAFGFKVALSADGNTMAVGAIDEDSAATGVDGNQIDNTASAAGAVYMFIRNGSSWMQQAYIKASNTEADDLFGYSLALSADGNTLAVGAWGEDSAATGVGGNQADNTASAAGAVYVFIRSGSSWAQQAYVKASNTESLDFFGYSLALNADGNTLAVSARFEDSAATGVGGDEADNSASNSGAVYVFTRSGSSWAQQAYVKASNTGASDSFGFSVSLSAVGNTLAVSAADEDSAATGVGGDEADNSASSAGAVYVFTRSGSSWAQQAYVKASNTGPSDGFGWSVSLSTDGNTLAVGSIREDSAATGVGGDEADNSASGSGAVYAFTRSGSSWAQQAYIKASNTGASDFFGFSVFLSADGNTLAVGARNEDSAATGLGGNEADNSASNSGAVYVFNRSGSSWAQQVYVKASNTGTGDSFGFLVVLSGDGNTLAVGVHEEDSAATGVGGDQADNTASGAGAVYLY